MTYYFKRMFLFLVLPGYYCAPSSIITLRSTDGLLELSQHIMTWTAGYETSMCVSKVKCRRIYASIGDACDNIDGGACLLGCLMDMYISLGYLVELMCKIIFANAAIYVTAHL